MARNGKSEPGLKEPCCLYITESPLFNVPSEKLFPCNTVFQRHLLVRGINILDQALGH